MAEALRTGKMPARLREASQTAAWLRHPAPPEKLPEARTNKPQEIGLVVVGSPLHAKLQEMPVDKMKQMIRLRTRRGAKLPTSSIPESSEAEES